MTEKTPDSRDVARAAINLAMTSSREEEAALKQHLAAQGIVSAASDFGGDYVSSVMKIIERAVVIAKREGLIGEKAHEEGAIQVFKQEGVGLESYIVGVVGVLQLEVLEYRLLNEYSAKLLMNQLPYSVARWVYAEDKKLIENIKGLDNGMLVYDKKDRPVILVNNEWSLNWILDRNPGIQFLTVPADVEKI